MWDGCGVCGTNDCVCGKGGSSGGGGGGVVVVVEQAEAWGSF